MKHKYNGFVRLFNSDGDIVRKVPAKTRAIIDAEAHVGIKLREDVKCQSTTSACIVAVELSDDAFTDVRYVEPKFVTSSTVLLLQKED